MVTQKDIHNYIVGNATFSQKVFLALQCQIHGVSVESVELSMANIVNGMVNAMIDVAGSENCDTYAREWSNLYVSNKIQ